MIDYNSVLTLDSNNKQAKTELGKLEQVMTHIHLRCTMCTDGVKEIMVSTIYIIYIMLYVLVFAEIKGIGGKAAAAAAAEAEGEGGDAIVRSSCLSCQKTTTFEVQGQCSSAAAVLRGVC